MVRLVCQVGVGAGEGEGARLAQLALKTSTEQPVEVRRCYSQTSQKPGWVHSVTNPM